MNEAEEIEVSLWTAFERLAHAYLIRDEEQAERELSLIRQLRERESSTTTTTAQRPREPEFPAVLAAAAAGEQWALTDLYRTYQPQLMAYLQTEESSDADDAAANVWLAVARGLDRFQGDEPAFRSWLFTIGRRQIANNRRRAAKRSSEPHRGVEIKTTHDKAELVSSTLARLGVREAVELLVTGLKAEEAEAVLLRVVGGFSVEEVGRIMDRTARSVRLLCHRALVRLAENLETSTDLTTPDAWQSYPKTGKTIATGEIRSEDELTDDVWEGAIPPDDAPPWIGEVAVLVHVAQRPERDDRLRGDEEAVVPNMVLALQGGPSS